MKYYTSTIPYTLAEKLKEKGMPMYETYHLGEGVFGIMDKGLQRWYYIPTYAFVFDWLLGAHEAFVYVTCLRMDDGWQYCGGIWGFSIDMTFGWRDTWHEAADAAIEKALTLI